MRRLISFLAIASALAAPAAAAAAGPIAVKVIIVTTFDQDYDNPKGTGEANGEASRWIERLHMTQVLPLPGAFRPIHMNTDGVVEIMTGMATARAAASTTALGLDPRFDLTKAYWILAGTAGVDPAAASQGSAAWAEWVVDGDLAGSIDPREIPPDWPDGRIPWDGTTPFDRPGANIGQFYHLNAGLVHWAYGLTKDTPIPDSPGMARFRALFTDYPAARRPPFVLMGDNLCSATYWQGTLATQWARRWVKLYTGGKGGLHHDVLRGQRVHAGDDIPRKGGEGRPGARSDPSRRKRLLRSAAGRHFGGEPQVRLRQGLHGGKRGF